MRKIVLQFHMSLDSVVSDPEKWFVMDDELLEEGVAYFESSDAVIMGSNTYAPLQQYWEEAEKSSASAMERKLAAGLNKMEKFLMSRSPKPLTWRNSKLLQFKDVAGFRKVL